MANKLDTRVPLMAQGPDYAGSVLKGVDLANKVMGRDDDMTPYQRETLELRRAALAQSGGLTPYQSRSLQLREQALNQPRQVNTTEAIRQKIASGGQLSPGEQKVYDDATKMSAFDRMLLGGAGSGQMVATPTNRTHHGAAPPPAAIQFLKANKNDPNVRRQFEEHYGQSADQW